MADQSADFRSPRVIGEQAARALRLELELGFAPIPGPHLWKLIAQRGIDLAFEEFGPNGGDGLYLWNGERGLIVLNASRRKPTRLRFTAAHELGHHEMHRHTLPSVLLSDTDILREQQTEIEQEANAFAAEFLAPQAALKKELDGRGSEEISPVDVVRLMRTYGLSYESMCWRLFNSRVITMADRERLAEEGQGRVMQIERMLGFTEEKLFAPPHLKLPEEFVLNVVGAYREGAVDEQRLGDLLRRTPEEARRVADEVQPAAEELDAAVDELLGL